MLFLINVSFKWSLHAKKSTCAALTQLSNKNREEISVKLKFTQVLAKENKIVLVQTNPWNNFVVHTKFCASVQLKSDWR